MPGSETQPPDANTPLRRLRRHLVWVIAVKLVLVAALYLLFFSPAQRPDLDDRGIAERLLPAG